MPMCIMNFSEFSRGGWASSQLIVNDACHYLLVSPLSLHCLSMPSCLTFYSINTVYIFFQNNSLYSFKRNLFGIFVFPTFLWFDVFLISLPLGVKLTNNFCTHGMHQLQCSVSKLVRSCRSRMGPRVLPPLHNLQLLQISNVRVSRGIPIFSNEGNFLLNISTSKLLDRVFGGLDIT